jgi:hypothetical protein
MKFLEICFVNHLEGEDTSFDVLLEKILNVYFFIYNIKSKHLKPEIVCKNNGK